MGLGVLGVDHSTSGLVPVAHAPSHEGGVDPVTASGIGAASTAHLTDAAAHGQVLGVFPLTKGGTGAASAGAALTALGAAPMATLNARLGAAVLDIAALRAVAVAGLTSGEQINIQSVFWPYIWQATGTGADNGAMIICPTAITPPAPGRWFRLDFITPGQLSSTTGGSEGAALVGTDAKVSLGNAATVEAGLTFLDGQKPRKFDTCADNPNAGAGTVGATGDKRLDTAHGVRYENMDGTATGWAAY